MLSSEQRDAEIDFFVNCDKSQVKAYKIFTEIKPTGERNTVVSDYTCGELMKVGPGNF